MSLTASPAQKDCPPPSPMSLLRLFFGAPLPGGLGGCMALPEAEPEAIVAGVVRVAGAGAFIFSEEPVETSDSFSFPFRLCPPLPIFWRGFTDSPTFFIFGFFRGQREVECP